MNRKLGWLLVGCLLPWTIMAGDVELTPLLQAEAATLWTMTPEAWAKLDPDHRLWSWNDNSHSALTVAPRRTGKVLLDKVELNDFRVFFTDGKTSRLEANLYNRAENRGLDNKSAFLSWLDGIQLQLRELAGREGSPKTTSSLDGNYIYSRFWQNELYRITLRWSYSGAGAGFHPEFVSLTVTAPGTGTDARASLKVAKTAAELKAGVKNNADGDRYLEVPMVDQGEKSYCVSAACERVLKYYGSEVDQHILAELGKTSLVGTDMEQMIKALQRIGGKLHFRCRELYMYKALCSESGINRMIAAYNVVASKEKRKKIGANLAAYDYMPLNVIPDMDPQLFRIVRTKERDFKEFPRQVRDLINNGTPVLWGVLLGIVKEKGLPQMNGGHLRLIIGYNEKSGQVIYSDSWGKAHAFKKMSWEDAWTMTTMLIVLQPRTTR